MTRKSEKASRKLHERSAKALTSWDGPPFDRGVAVPTEIWSSWLRAEWRTRIKEEEEEEEAMRGMQSDKI